MQNENKQQLYFLVDVERNFLKRVVQDSPGDVPQEFFTDIYTTEHATAFTLDEATKIVKDFNGELCLLPVGLFDANVFIYAEFLPREQHNSVMASYKTSAAHLMHVAQSLIKECMY